MRKISENGGLNAAMIEDIMLEEKPNQKEKVSVAYGQVRAAAETALELVRGLSSERAAARIRATAIRAPVASPHVRERCSASALAR